MGAVAVAQHLHTTVAVFKNNNVTSGIERDARGKSESAGTSSFVADGADMRAVAVAQHLHAMVAPVGNNKVAFAVKRRRSAIASLVELPVAAALAADGADVGAVAEPMHLHTSVTLVKNSNVALAIDGDARGMVELSVACASAADCANMAAVAVAQHLHAMAFALRYNNVPRAIKRYAAGFIELPVPCSTAADAAQVHPVAVPQDLNATVEKLAHHQVALAIKRNATRRKPKLPITRTFAADDAHEACTRSCNRPQPPRQFVAPRQNAGGFPPRILHGALASETQQPRGKRHAQAAAGEQTLPLLGPELQAECATLCGRDTKERWARAEDGLQLPLAASERP